MPDDRRYLQLTRTVVLESTFTIQNADEFQDLWNLPGLVSFKGADGPLSIVSDSAQDAPGNSGAHSLLIRGTTPGPLPTVQVISIALDGTDSVITAESFEAGSLLQAHVLTATDLESLALPAGTITISQDGTSLGKILPGERGTAHAFARIGYSAAGAEQIQRMVDGRFSISDAQGQPPRVDLEVMVQTPGTCFRTVARSHLDLDISSSVPLKVFSDFKSGDNVCVRVKSDQTGVLVMVEFTVKVYDVLAAGSAASLADDYKTLPE